ncbi:unnamed protein product [Strongylus vulgaris]|uniref:Tyrosine-protein phosphatase domain-containing protein n=1 Tax=Strongylus vulgaris TaxID=40348 RepID=A0A3P7LIW6_STRVU|nr:unnamed protein product [Strongylus vulgaris]
MVQTPEQYLSLTVDALRRQRSRMVQTPEQYLSLYEAISLAIVEERL